jgi:hypothetical protein
MLQKSSAHLLENEYNTVTKRGINAQSIVSSGMNCDGVSLKPFFHRALWAINLKQWLN